MLKPKKNKSKFLKVKCDDCGSEQVIFDSVASKVKCLVCGKLLAEPTGGKARIYAKEIRVLE